MTDQQVRGQRVNSGSRRQRDLEAVTPRIDWLEWVRTNLPDEHPCFASPAAQLLRRADLERKMPTAEQVRERLVSEGKDAETLRAKGWM